MRVGVHVKPNASGTRVGGSHDGVLVVRVTQRPDRGRATEAALAAVADSLRVPRGAVTLVRGASSRRKLLEVDLSETDRPSVEARLADLLEQEGG